MRFVFLPIITSLFLAMLSPAEESKSATELRIENLLESSENYVGKKIEFVAYYVANSRGSWLCVDPEKPLEEGLFLSIVGPAKYYIEYRYSPEEGIREVDYWGYKSSWSKIVGTLRRGDYKLIRWDLTLKDHLYLELDTVRFIKHKAEHPLTTQAREDMWKSAKKLQLKSKAPKIKIEFKPYL